MSWFDRPSTEMRQARLDTLANLAGQQANPAPIRPPSATFNASEALLAQICSQAQAQAAAKAATEPPVFGAKIGNLTQIANKWIDLSQVAYLNLHPEDGCGAEVFFHGATTVAPIHFNAWGARCLRCYLESELAKQTKASEEVKQLEEIASK